MRSKGSKNERGNSVQRIETIQEQQENAVLSSTMALKGVFNRMNSH